MTAISKDIVSWLKQWFYTEDEVDDLIPTISFGFDDEDEELYVEVN